MLFFFLSLAEYASSEDLELAQEREALGLPLAFTTAKEASGCPRIWPYYFSVKITF